METFSGKYRELAGVSAQLAWVTGVTSLAGVAYALPNWRNLQLLITLCPVIILPCLLYVHCYQCTYIVSYAILILIPEI